MSTISQLTCRTFVELVTDYFEGALPRADRKRFERHVAACDGCDAYLEQMRMTLELLGRIDPGEVPPEAQERLLAAFRDWRSHARAGPDPS
jgi:anti-sigma factor RsiW